MSPAEIAALPDASGWAAVLAGALTAGSITGFSGFGTALVASGFWYVALPPAMVPPLAAIAAVVGQAVGLFAMRAAFDRHRTLPFRGGGVPGARGRGPACGRIAGCTAQHRGRPSCGLCRLAAERACPACDRPLGGRPADGLVGLVGGVLGGFAALSGPAPIVWLHLRGGPSLDQRAVYQPFNLVVLARAAGTMAVAGRIGRAVLTVAGGCVPLSLAGAWLGVRPWRKAGEAPLRRVVPGLLMASGLALVAQTILR